MLKQDERLNQMVASDDCSGSLKRIGRIASNAKKVTRKMNSEGFDA